MDTFSEVGVVNNWKTLGVTGRVDLDELTVGGLAVVGGATGNPVGPVNSVQTNNSGVFAGSASLTFDSTSGLLTIGDGSSLSGTLFVAGNGSDTEGVIAVRDNLNAHSFTILGATIGSSGSGIYMRDSDGIMAVNLLANGASAGNRSQLILKDVAGHNSSVLLASDTSTNGASLVLSDINGSASTTLNAASPTVGGQLLINDTVGANSIQLNGGIPGTVGGYLQVNDWNNNLRVNIAGNGGGVLNVDPGGSISLYNTANQLTVELDAGHSGDGGGNVLSMLRSDGLANSGLYMGASNTSGEPSKLAMFQGLGDQTLTCEVYGGDGTTYGGRINLYGINNQGGIRIEGNTALTGNGNAFVGTITAYSSVANIGIDFATSGTGTLNFHAPVVFPSYLTTTLPTAPVGAQIFVANANGGVGTMAFYNGTHWIDIKTGVTVTA